ncbi:MAG: hypothetical protein A3G28_07365 [Betaproteobacteria bacterium RIFCSPLOWO2_12_FULL_68_19]|nr:MAG: hypothetical protein A3G28_07365 [Betaproteobacteria bacterium RIFCSPLOWO2_12_FULL_68_19]
MNADDVATYLRTHPQFFERHPELLETIQVPHPYGGRAIPLAERQTVALREKARLLEGKLGELIQFGEENDAISEKVHRLAVAIAGARDFPALAQSLYFHLREDFAVPHVALRVWGKSVPVDFEEAAAVDEAQRRHAAALTAPQCGAAAGSPFAPWFGDAAAQLRSLALVPLGQTAVFGLLALGSEDPQRFFPEMGTVYLRRIGELCAAAVTARL